ncbi:MAG TPA: cation-translocating P-type ATPase [Propionicimonas sp.]|jgi:heavy metal translocating P-type ATPase|uniref:heavy metal translocating P-type ATPase n=1 Tax=Propionicimonas sp. TaxID=1955623 RepID=UPI002F40BB1C
MTTSEATVATTDYAPETLASLWRRIDADDLVRVGVVAGLAVVAAGSSWLGGPAWLVIGAAVVGLVAGCWPIVGEAWEDLRSRRMSMELSMLIAIVAAALIGEWVTALVITAFVLAAEILEDLTMDRGRDALTDLMTFLPSVVHLRVDGVLHSVPLDQVQVADVVMVLPGERVPVDGTVADGRSSLDQSRITGEPLPVDVAEGSAVFAGSVNTDGAIAVRAERVGAASSYGQIVAAVKAAQESQAPVQRLADRVAGWLVYVALGGAAITYLVTRDLTATISVVIVAGACGVAAGTPLAVLAAIARTARAGAFIKDGTHLEQLSVVDTVVFDKTGTLSEGKPGVSGVTAVPGAEPEAVLAAAAGAELYSEHPIGRAIVAHARATGVEVATPQDFVYRPGLGVTATVAGRQVRTGNAVLVPEAGNRESSTSTAVHVAVDDAYLGSITIADTIRESAPAAVDALRGLGLHVVMMTGDSTGTARAVGSALKIDEVHADLLPTDKVGLITRLRHGGARVAMVGDGVNDAPALAEASVGIAMGSGTHVAAESADVILISSDLNDLTRAITTARRARRIVVVNFVGTIAVDLIGMALAATGLIGPILAAIIHVGSESAFILNSARLIPSRRQDGRA